MAQASTIKGGKIRILLGDSASPEVFTAPCGMTQRGLTLTKALNDVVIPDCIDPDKVSWLGRDAASLSMSISGQGVLASESIEAWLDAGESIDSVSAKVEIEFPATTYTYTGKMHVESLEIGANNGERATITISMQSDGEMVRTSV
ncbi:phage tail protein [Mesorhizobium sp. BR1-1-13]|uniref:phage tail tube protein n=1 Tax=Mesorhizobium sp. BR1-1-13 TaxID=2876656 RepID=UPI001CD10D62|nr:phage tail tube protein [Mesorhizobium sp. BR1-1-13]MBZ9943439.1 phage tail protein [Mesorhizobium sp. BR1-1-13]